MSEANEDVTTEDVVTAEVAVEEIAVEEVAPAEAAAVEETVGVRSARKVREGLVTSANMDKTIVVTVSARVRHPRYNKFVVKSTNFFAHDETNDAGLGDRVRIMETRPLSKKKRWRLTEILERAR